MNIFIVLSGPFPHGTASTVRLISYAREMTILGNDVEVLCFKPTEDKSHIKNNKILGVHEHVKFRYTCSTTIKPNNVFQRACLNSKGFIKALKYMHHYSKRKRIDIILPGINNFFVLTILFLFSKLKGSLLLQERSEYPFILMNKNLYNRLGLFLYLNIALKYFDGIIVISNGLRNYFRKRVRKTSFIYLLPMIIDAKEFVHSSYNPKINCRYIGYCGSMGGEKDGVNILLHSFEMIASRIKDVCLILIGSKSFPEYKNYKEMIKRAGVENRVMFVGKKNKEELAGYLKHAIVLALARPANKQAEGGFPNKLGEYLATGNPVVLTRVGDIPAYIRDRENGFLAEPGNPSSFAEKLIEVLENPDKSSEVGKKGEKLVHTKFNSKIQTEKLCLFLNEKLNNKDENKK